ncbi:MAG: hypothetical protein UU71_C0008G0015 [Parcubacteria group bacterium GW2011_GWB1_41_6]|nr:MAG: hypothetical protein UU71_C0008G0015 [Parcubacteria group bacterium GW2011_GWB1_41_6]KKS34353.1 MAG: hypothetical protein UU96_C0005G0017 [Parcubacteria group bacterium GW2011_GWC2_42_13]KKS56818.1 MAG: hypothetical protein UV22_C0025G0005 [Parcubacteria group bacterium GW2011_GWA2_42_35]
MTENGRIVPQNKKATVCLLRSKYGKEEKMNNVEVCWRGEKPTAEEVSGKISVKMGRPIQAHTKLASRFGFGNQPREPEWDIHMLIAEEDDFRKAVSDVGKQMKDALKEEFGVEGTLQINGWDLGTMACNQYAMRVRFEKGIKEAVADLKKTKSWLKNAKIADIRRRLEQVLTD